MVHTFDFTEIEEVITGLFVASDDEDEEEVDDEISDDEDEEELE